MLTPTTRRRRRPTAAAHASGANAFQKHGRVSRADLPQVKGIAPAGKDTVILTFASGEVVTVTARDGIVMSPDGLLVIDYRNSGPVYLIPSPHDRWLAKVHLNLYSGKADSEEARLDAYLMCLPSITEACVIDDVLTLGCIGPDGRPVLQQFTGELTVQLGRHEPSLDFTRFPLTMTLIEDHGEDRKVYALRVDHTPEGYAALRALGWDAPLPDLEQTTGIGTSGELETAGKDC